MGYYYLYPFFRTLLQELGAEPIVSPPTTKRLLERMDVCPTDEPCLAVKLHFSHADALAQRDDIDFLLLPVIASVEQTFCCPKFIGVGDMIRHGLQLSEDRALLPVIDYSESVDALISALTPLAVRIGVRDQACLHQAICMAQEAQRAYRSYCVKQQCTTPEAYAALEHGSLDAPCHIGGREIDTTAERSTIAVIGHPYILYDITSLGMIERLREFGNVVTAEMVDQTLIDHEMMTIKEGPRLWPFEAMLLGSALHLLRSGTIDKMILVGSFECGPESIIESYIEDEAHRLGVPLMVLAMDEHSGEAGLVTRIEAFMDTERLPGHTPPPMPAAHPAFDRKEMVVGFPSMGHLDEVIRAFVESCGVRTIPTPRTTKMCIELGREIAPEFACFPFTATLGQMRYLLDHGVNTLLMVGGKQYCRLGWYAQLQEQLLRNLGYDFHMLIIESPFPLQEKWAPFRDMVKTLTGHAPWPKIIQGMVNTYHQLRAMDHVDATVRRLRAFECDRGAADRIGKRYLRQVPQTFGVGAIRRLMRQFDSESARVNTEDTHPLRVKIVGEIWVVLEQSATRDLEAWLGSREYPRVWVEREHSSSQWFDANVLHRKAAMGRHHEIVDAARPWLAHKVGGHGQHTVGELALARQQGFDGVLHVFPFTCMPEIIAQNIMVRMSEELDIPILTYIVSEQTGEAGMETRLESFLDLLEERRLQQALEPGFPLLS